MVAEVATLEPEQAAKTAQDAMLVCSRPPGRKTSQRDSAPYMRSPMPERSISSPMSRNSGTATRMKLVLLSQALLPRMFHSGASENICIITRDSTPSAPATYSPIMKKTPIMLKAAMIAIFQIPRCGGSGRFAGCPGSEK